MKKSDAKKLIVEKIDDLKSIIAQLKTTTTLSKSTRGTQLYARGKERRVLQLLHNIITQLPDDKLKLSEDDMNTFVLITTLSTERPKQVQVEVHEGDFLPAVLQKYADVKKVYDKIMKACADAGLTMTADGKFVRGAKE